MTVAALVFASVPGGVVMAHVVRNDNGRFIVYDLDDQVTFNHRFFDQELATQVAGILDHDQKALAEHRAKIAEERHEKHE